MVIFKFGVTSKSKIIDGLSYTNLIYCVTDCVLKILYIGGEMNNNQRYVCQKVKSKTKHAVKHFHSRPHPSEKWLWSLVFFIKAMQKVAKLLTRNWSFKWIPRLPVSSHRASLIRFNHLFISFCTSRCRHARCINWHNVIPVSLLKTQVTRNTAFLLLPRDKLSDLFVLKASAGLDQKQERHTTELGV